MSRRKRVIKHEVKIDPKYKSSIVAQFIGVVLNSGKKSVAENIFYRTIDLLAEKTQQDGMGVFKKALNNVKPVLEVKSRRIGGATYQVPMEVSPSRRTALAIRWIVSYAKGRKEKSMVERLTAELLQASNNEGSSVKKKEDTHKMAEANKAFAHFRW
jgi:small subunit ribosomal protein S7